MNSVFDKDEVIRFFLLQSELVKALFKTYPMAKDIEWLLDFPKMDMFILMGMYGVFPNMERGSGSL